MVLARVVAFSSSTAWNRYLIWQFGSAELMRHPIFGMGLFEDWQRAPWMPASIDNHWLLMSMRYGLPGIGLLLGAYFYITIRLIRQNFSHDPELDWIRKAFVFTFPEVHLVTLAALLLLGRYTGYRLSEWTRFRAFRKGGLEKAA